MLIYDEIVTGFRLAIGGAQEAFGVLRTSPSTPRLSAAGFPLSAFAGSTEVMTPIALNTVKHGGTYNGNPIFRVCSAGDAQCHRPARDDRADARGGEALMEEIRRSGQGLRRHVRVQGVGSMFQVLFGVDQPTRQYRDIPKLGHEEVRRLPRRAPRGRVSLQQLRPCLRLHLCCPHPPRCPHRHAQRYERRCEPSPKRRTRIPPMLSKITDIYAHFATPDPHGRDVPPNLSPSCNRR